MLRLFRRLFLTYLICRVIVSGFAFAVAGLGASGNADWAVSARKAVLGAAGPVLIEIQKKRAEMMGMPMPETLEARMRHQLELLTKE